MGGLGAAVGQRAVYAILGAVAALLVISMFAANGSDYKNDRQILITVARLKAAGWAPASGEAPTIKDRPRGSRPVAVVQGRASYPPVSEPGKAPATDVDAVPPSRSLVAGADPLCDLDAIAVDIRCRSEIVELDGIPAARLFVSGRLERGGAMRELPETRVEGVTLAARIPPRLPRHIELRAGVSTRPAAVLGATVYREGRHVGWWGQYEHPLTVGETATGAVGVANRW